MLGRSHGDVVVVISFSWLWSVSVTIKLRPHVCCDVCSRIIFKYVISGSGEMDLCRMGVMTAVHLITWLVQVVNRLCHTLMIGAIIFIIVCAPLECPSLGKLWGLSSYSVGGNRTGGRQASAEFMVGELVEVLPHFVVVWVLGWLEVVGGDVLEVLQGLFPLSVGRRECCIKSKWAGTHMHTHT